MLAGTVFAILFVWVILQSRSEYKLKKIRNKFFELDQTERQLHLEMFKKHLFFLKFSRFMLEKLPYIVMAVIIIIVSGPFGVLVVLFARWFMKSLKQTNYRGYNKYDKSRHLQEMDEWVVIANQTILNE